MVETGVTEFTWIDMGDGRSVYRRITHRTDNRSDLPAPMVITDTMDALRHPATGDMVDSKAHFRKVTRDHGAQEVGTDQVGASAPKDTTYAADVGGAIQKLKSGYKPAISGEGSAGWTDPN